MRRSHLTATLASFTLVSLAACGGGGGGSSSSNSGNNNTGGNNNTNQTAPGSMSLTDAASDQISQFEVTVTAIDMTRQDGAVVHALPQSQRVDFAELVNESQLLSAFSLLAGTYKSVSISFDASANPEVQIQGNASPATLLDPSGNPVSGIVTETIQFPNQNPLVVTPGLHNDIVLDFDLDSSCTIDATANTVQLGNVFQATQSAAAPKVQNVLATLVGVDTTAGVCSVTLNAPLALQTGPTFAFALSSSATYFVNGASSTLAGFAAMPAGSGVLARGNWNGTSTFTAVTVECWTPEDAVEGHVISRDQAGNLTVLGWGEVVGSGSRTYNSTWTVNATTAPVFQRPLPCATAQPGTKQDESYVAVGQRVRARGKLAGQSLDATQTGGHVVLLETGIFGYAAGAPSGSTLTMNVARIGRRNIARFNFTVGTTVTADPTNYLVNVSTLASGLTSLTAGAPISVRGILTPITTPAGGANANALTVTDRSAEGAFLAVGWPLRTAKPFTSASSSECDLDLAGTGRRFVDQGFVSDVQFQTTDSPKLVPNTSAPAPIYAIEQAGSLTVYSSFASWEADVTGRLASGSQARFLAAVGHYDPTSKTFSAGRAILYLR